MTAERDGHTDSKVVPPQSPAGLRKRRRVMVSAILCCTALGPVRAEPERPSQSSSPWKNCGTSPDCGTGVSPVPQYCHRLLSHVCQFRS